VAVMVYGMEKSCSSSSYKFTFFGDLAYPGVNPERIIFYSMYVLIFWLGVYLHRALVIAAICLNSGVDIQGA